MKPVTRMIDRAAAGTKHDVDGDVPLTVDPDASLNIDAFAFPR
jgi:hypothetical protein